MPEKCYFSIYIFMHSFINTSIKYLLSAFQLNAYSGQESKICLYNLDYYNIIHR